MNLNENVKYVVIVDDIYDNWWPKLMDLNSKYQISNLEICKPLNVSVIYDNYVKTKKRSD